MSLSPLPNSLGFERRATAGRKNRIREDRLDLHAPGGSSEIYCTRAACKDRCDAVVCVIGRGVVIGTILAFIDDIIAAIHMCNATVIHALISPQS